jgi:uncharacterized membrane protein
MRLFHNVDNNSDTTGWGAVGVLLALLLTPDIFAQAIVVILFPAVGWTILYFIKRELIYRFPPKINPKELKDKDDLTS